MGINKITSAVETLFRKYLPSPFTIAVFLSLITMLLAFFFTSSPEGENHAVNILKYWESGIWNNGLLVFAYQMMLILVLGHVLVLSKPVSWIILQITKYVRNTANAVVIVSVSTMLVSFFNWGLGLIFGAILARKVGEYAQKNQIPVNYPLIGAAGYVGLMVWHGGISGSAPLKVSESGHLQSLMESISEPAVLAQLPDFIPSYETIFSWWNLLLFAVVLILIPLVLYRMGKKLPATPLSLDEYEFEPEDVSTKKGAEKLDYSRLLASFFGLIILLAFVFQYSPLLRSFNLTPNLLNFFMLGLAIILHGNFRNFLSALDEAIKDTSGILIQFPLYFGIMGIMSSSGMVNQIAEFFTSIATETTLPIFTFFSAGLVNIFVPSGGGQWAVQGPIVIESALKLGVPLPKAVMALAYGDQITNMLQPFWALPLLAITKLKAREILPYTLIMMICGVLAFLLGLFFL
ncbi:TIGR00366 family protein [Leptobacterium flavescens]|uniref:TIGR00366 family protein n=1 Tax=Leptobacterium flavescens TaxID=472055 RepID=A0A6P0UMT7_9FLAO|nr:TIGR00366 family protein [Leptobacterium flavescens]NER14574.1 TIGR00366 family protein [Leptobacterium flavescens]